jgi:NAD(P)-dependent dehydrogenase (short-subunit alcohol dehydrogenase family)
VGETGTFAAFRDTVAAVLRDTWQRDTFDYLVNNAGFAQTSLIEDTTEETFDRLMRVLLKGPYFLTQRLLPLMADGGAVVNTSSNSAATAGLEPGYSAYASMKGGLDVLTRYMAKEFSTRGIRVNAVSPGSTRTRIADDAFTRFPEVVPALAAKTALGPRRRTRRHRLDDRHTGATSTRPPLMGASGSSLTAASGSVSGRRHRRAGDSGPPAHRSSSSTAATPSRGHRTATLCSTSCARSGTRPARP